MTVAGLAGCGNPEVKRSDQLEQAERLLRDKAYSEALKLLEALTLEYPNDADILTSIGRVYTEMGDHTMAAFYLEQAHLLRPDDAELLYQTYQSLKAAGQATGPSLEKLAGLNQDALTPALWVELGAYRAEKNQTESALSAYLKGVDPEKRKPEPETAAVIGELFAQLGNPAQAAYWLGMAANTNDPTALTALFALLQLQLSQNNWPAAEVTIARLDKEFPGAIEASEWKEDREKILRWRSAQNELKAKLAAAEAEKEEVEAAETRVPETESAVEVASVEGLAVAEVASNTQDAPTTESPKAQVIADLDAAEALANAPALETVTTEIEGPLSDASLAETNPNNIVQPADPDWGISLDFDQVNTAPGASVRSETEAQDLASSTIDSTEPVFPDSALPPTGGARTLEDILAEAEKSELDRDFKGAIRKYWAAISIVNNRAEIWNLLARAYLADGQLQNADIAALESVRLAPDEVAYTLDFLRVAQRSRPPEKFLVQLETAYDRFPSSPEITLTLARAMERISKDYFVARNLYQRFIEIAPNHPLVPEAKAAVARLN